MRKRHIFLLGFFLCFFRFETITAGELSFSRSVTVASVYWDTILKSWENETEWVFSCSDGGAGAGGSEMEVARKGVEMPTAILRYDAEGKLVEVVRLLIEHGQTRRIADAFSDKIALSQGFPVPYDYLAPDDREMSAATIKKRAGGMVFSYQIARRITEGVLEQALAEGFVREEIKDRLGGRAMRWIEIKKDDSLMVRQLWAEGLPWWVYEETPFRKSWLVKITMQN